MPEVDGRWLAWVLRERVDAAAAFMRADTMDFALMNPEPYASKLHYVPKPIGGYRDSGNGQAGRAVCGAAVPADDGDTIYMWLDNTEVRKTCKRCVKVVSKW